MNAKKLANLIATLKQKGITSQVVLDAIKATPRHLFVDADQEIHAYEDRALVIGYQQVITQPYLVARMTELLLAEKPLTRVLEIGTGSGYQAAVLAKLVTEVYSIERILPLYLNAKKRLDFLKLDNVKLFYGDGSRGLPEYAPYEGIIVTAATDHVPKILIAQLAIDGVMIIPIGSKEHQMLYKIKRLEKTYSIEALDSVLFVPLISGETE